MMKKCFVIWALLFVSILFVHNNFAQDTVQWHLPASAKARIGKSRVNDMALSPDSTQLAVATDIGIWLYNAKTGAEISLLTGHGEAIQSVAYAPNGQTLAAGGLNQIHLWNPNTQKHKVTFAGQGNILAYAPNGQTLVTGGQDIDLLDAQTGKQKLSLETGLVTKIVFSPDGNRLASTGDNEDTTIRLWNARKGQLQRTLSGHTASINDIVFSPDGKTLVSGSWDGTIRLWNSKTGKLIRTIQEWSNFLAYSPNGKTIAVGQGNSIYLLNENTGDSQQVLRYSSNVSSMIFSSDGSTMVSRNWDGTIGFWDTGFGSLRLTIEGHFNFGGIAVSPNGKTIVTVNDDALLFWNTVDGRFNKVLKVGKEVGPTDYSPDGKILAIGTFDDTPQIHLLNARTGNHRKTLSYQGETIADIAFSPDSKTLASRSWEGTIYLWNTQNGKRLQTLEGQAGFTRSLAFSPDGKTLANVSSEGTIYLWNTQNGKRLQTLEGQAGFAQPLAFSPDGKTLANVSSEGTIYLWNTQNGKRLQTLEGQADFAQSLAFSPDGKTLASGEWDGISLWNARTGELRQRLAGVSLSVNWLAFTPDSKTLISQTDGSAILLWDLDALPKSVAEDVNRDGIVDVKDLVTVASSFGESVKKEANPNPDVNGDGVVNRQDILKVLTVLEAASGAPALLSQSLYTLTAGNLQHWIDHAKRLNNMDVDFQNGIRVLEQLLVTLATESRSVPTETVLLANYPNPFNPETWIPYQLAAPADISIAIYTADGKLVRTLDLGYQAAGYYDSRSRAAYWDGRNALGEPVASGVYFSTLTAGDFTATQKMLIRK